MLKRRNALKRNAAYRKPRTRASRMLPHNCLSKMMTAQNRADGIFTMPRP